MVFLKCSSLTATLQTGTITQSDRKIIPEEALTVKDTTERKALNFAVHKTRKEQRDHVLRSRTGWNGFSWLRTRINGGHL